MGGRDPSVHLLFLKCLQPKIINMTMRYILGEHILNPLTSFLQRLVQQLGNAAASSPSMTLSPVQKEVQHLFWPIIYLDIFPQKLLLFFVKESICYTVQCGMAPSGHQAKKSPKEWPKLPGAMTVEAGVI